MNLKKSRITSLGDAKSIEKSYDELISDIDESITYYVGNNIYVNNNDKARDDRISGMLLLHKCEVSEVLLDGLS